jgi:hypothetical protein
MKQMMNNPISGPGKSGVTAVSCLKYEGTILSGRDGVGRTKMKVK